MATIKSTNHYLTGSDVLNVLALPGRNYLELDGIRIVCDDNEIVGWYDPNGTESKQKGAGSNG